MAKKPQPIADRLREVHNRTVELLWLVDTLQRQFDQNIVLDVRDVVDQLQFLEQRLDNAVWRIRSVEELFVAGFLSVCRATGCESPAKVQGKVSSCFHLAAGWHAMQAGQRILNDIFFESESIDGENGITTAESTFDKITDTGHFKEEFWDEVPKILQSRTAVLPRWSRFIGDINIDTVEALLRLELVEAIEASRDYPYNISAPGPGGARPFDSELVGETIPINGRYRPPNCGKCGGKNKVNKSPNGGMVRYLVCLECGHKSKRPIRLDESP